MAPYKLLIFSIAKFYLQQKKTFFYFVWIRWISSTPDDLYFLQAFCFNHWNFICYSFINYLALYLNFFLNFSLGISLIILFHLTISSLKFLKCSLYQKICLEGCYRWGIDKFSIQFCCRWNRVVSKCPNVHPKVVRNNHFGIGFPYNLLSAHF